VSNWQLPEGIDELTGDQAITFEQSRRDLLDLYQSWGYEVVVPPNDRVCRDVSIKLQVN